MKTKLLLPLAFLLFSASVFGQDDKPIKRPEDIGVSDFDSFKNTSFDILMNADRLKLDTKRVDDAVKQYPTGTGLSIDRVKGDYNALKRIKSETSELAEKIPTLDDQGKQLVENAKEIKPKLKSFDAVANTNKSMKALEKAKTSLTDTGKLVDTNLKIVTDALKAQGETITNN